MEESGIPSATGDDECEKRKKRGPVGKLFFKVGERMGIVEQTRLAPEFVTEIEKYYKYQEDVDKLVDRLEIVLQNDETVLRSGNIECSEKTDPYEIFAQNINAFRSFQPENAQVSLTEAEAVVKRLAIMNREMQSKGRRSIHKMRQFVTHEKLAMIEAQKKLMQARDTMDAARHDLKHARTTEMVEEKGKYYERMVREFDQQAARVAAFPEHLPADKEEHQKELFDYFETLGNFHQNANLLLEEHLPLMKIPPTVTITNPRQQ
ncbi:BAR domain family protein [Brugia pahangi]